MYVKCIAHIMAMLKKMQNSLQVEIVWLAHRETKGISSLQYNNLIALLVLCNYCKSAMLIFSEWKLSNWNK